MRQFDYIVTDPSGLYADPAVLLGKKVREFSDTVVTVSKDGNSAPATKLMALIGLGVKCGDLITISVEGGDEEKAAATMEEYVVQIL